MFRWFSQQGKFIRIHFGHTGKLASADIDICERTLKGAFLLLSVTVSPVESALQIFWKNPE